MQDPLATYVHDHLAGATFAVELLEALQDRYSSEPLGEFARHLLVEVKEDRATLQQLTGQLGGGSNLFKEAASWFSEKASRLKLRHQTEEALGTFESLEALALGILGKEALWTTLAHLSGRDSLIQKLDYPTLLTRARAQHAQTEKYRIALADTTFANSKQ